MSVAAIQTIASLREATPTVDLSAYSSLSVAAMTVGYETLLDVPMPSIVADLVTATIDSMVSSAVAQAMSSLASIPVIGAIFGFVGDVAQDIVNLYDDDLRRRREEEAVREQQARLARLRPVGTGIGGRVMPADMLARYLVPGGAEVSPPIEGTARPVSGLRRPTIGETLVEWGGMDPLVTPEEFAPLRASSYRNAMTGLGFLAEKTREATGYPGPSLGQSLVFHSAARAIADSRRRPETDGGISLWPVVLDCLRSSASFAPKAYWDWWFGHGATYDGKVDSRGVALRSAWRIYDTPLSLRAIAPWNDAVAELRRSWELTIYPIYRQDRAQAEELRREIENTVRRLLRPMIPLATPVARRVQAAVRGRRGRAALLAGAGIGAVAWLRPEWLSAVARVFRRSP